MPAAIPQSVLDLLWAGRPHGGHRPRALYRPDDAAGRVINGLTYASARALVDDGVIRNDWVGAGAGIAIPGYEQAALDRFCAEVYAAGDRFKARPRLREVA